MPTPPRVIKVFIASPSDLAVERRAFKEVIDELNKACGRWTDVRFEPLGWEDALSQVGRRPQAVINQDVDACDVFVLVMWRRWGQEAPDAAPFTSYTEEEFQRALARFERGKAPTIFVFFKHVDAGQMADPGPQLTKVLEFRKQMEQSRRVLYRQFSDEKSFKEEIDRHLVSFARGETSPQGCDGRVLIIPEALAEEVAQANEKARIAVEALEKLKASAEKDQREKEEARAAARDAEARAEAAEQLAEAKFANRSIDLATKAARAALEGRIEEARQDFATALDGTTNHFVLSIGSEFYERIGDLDEAERLLRRSLSISGPDSATETTACAYGNLGKLEQKRENWEVAETFGRKALALFERLGDQFGIADQLCHLGLVEMNRENFDLAETLLKKAMAIHEQLGCRERLGIHLGNLGALEQKRGDLAAAEVYHKKAIEIDSALGQTASLAGDYNGLGNVECRRGNLDLAETYYKKALEISEKVGRQDWISNHLGNLGVVELERGFGIAAEAYFKRALAINERLGRQEAVATDFLHLGEIEATRGNFDAAETYYKRALAIRETRHQEKSMIQLYLALAQVADARGNVQAAEHFKTMASGLIEKNEARGKAIRCKTWLEGFR